MDKDIIEIRQELQSLRQEWPGFSRRRLVLWLIRWTTGFAVIGIIVFFNPEWSWLWWAGLGFAALTPAATLTGQWFLSRKIRDSEVPLLELEETIRKLEDD
jgi:hypothetical protein